MAFQISGECRYVLDTVLSLPTTGKGDVNCLYSRPMGPADLAIDEERSFYIIEDGNQSVRKIDSTGLTMWDVQPAGEQVHDLCYFDGSLYVMAMPRILRLDPTDGSVLSVSQIDLTWNQLGGFSDNRLLMYEGRLYANLASCGYWALSTITYDLKSGERIDSIPCYSVRQGDFPEKGYSWFPIPDCERCNDYLQGFVSSDLVGQSQAYAVIWWSGYDDSEPLKVLLLDKASGRFFLTSLADLMIEGRGYHQYRFSDDTTAYFLQYSHDRPMAHFVRMRIDPASME